MTTAKSATLPMVVIEGIGLSEQLRSDVDAAAQSALHEILTWGQLKVPVIIIVHANHHELERAIGQQNLPWLRAWAQYDRIDLQSPTTFGHRDYQRPLTELLTHELTHVYMYQHIAQQDTWSRVWVPFWFREGMASWTARQGYRRGTHASLERRLAGLESALDPLVDGGELALIDQPLAYGAAHWAFAHLIDQHGQESIIAILDDLRRCDQEKLQQSKQKRDTSQKLGPQSMPDKTFICGFQTSFERRIGMSEHAFAQAFRQSLMSAAGDI